MKLMKTFILASVVVITSPLTLNAQIISDIPAPFSSNHPTVETKFQIKTPKLSYHNSEKLVSVESLKNQKVIFFELLGNGGFYSVNYEHFIKDRVSLRGGVSYMFHSNVDSFVDFGGLAVVPISINRIMHIKGDSFFETSIGTSFAFYDGKKGLFIVSGIGFREQPTGKGTFTRVTLNPLLYSDNGARFGITASISLGFSFK